MKGSNTFTKAEVLAIKLILTRIFLGGNKKYQQSLLRKNHAFYISDFNYYSLPGPFGVKDFDDAVINGDILII